MSTKRILITGASGFIGQALVRTLCNSGREINCAVRSTLSVHAMTQFRQRFNLPDVNVFNVGQLSDATDWKQALDGVETIIHCAARVHILDESNNPDSLQKFRAINTQATTHLAQLAIKHKVRRFIFLSSIGVLGTTSNASPFTDDTIPNPMTPYTLSKFEAEQNLKQLAKDIEIVIVRPPLVYGHGVSGNFDKLLKLISKGLPIPLGGIRNKRQFLGIDNLIDFIMHCVDSPLAANQTFLIADKEVVSTTELIRLIAKLMGGKVFLLPIPQQVLKYFLFALGKAKMADQLLNNLEIKADNARTLLNWEPPYTMLEQLKKVVNPEL